MAKRGKIIALYRVKPIELAKPTRHVSVGGHLAGPLPEAKSQVSSGIAIVEAGSLMEVKDVIAEFQDMAPHEAFLTTYVQYEIKRLEDVLEK